MSPAAARPRRVVRGASRAVRVRKLDARGRRLFEIAPDLLLVFKPRGLVEERHSHPHGQVLRVLRGRLLFESGGREHRLGPGSPPFRVRARTLHATLALEDTWLAVERKPARTSRAAGRPA